MKVFLDSKWSLCITLQNLTDGNNLNNHFIFRSKSLIENRVNLLTCSKAKHSKLLQWTWVKSIRGIITKSPVFQKKHFSWNRQGQTKVGYFVYVAFMCSVLKSVCWWQFSLLIGPQSSNPSPFSCKITVCNSLFNHRDSFAICLWSASLLRGCHVGVLMLRPQCSRSKTVFWIYQQDQKS